MISTQEDLCGVRWELHQMCGQSSPRIHKYEINKRYIWGSGDLKMNFPGFTFHETCDISSLTSKFAKQRCGSSSKPSNHEEGHSDYLIICPIGILPRISPKT